jgi:hypothetical protein
LDINCSPCTRGPCSTSVVRRGVAQGSSQGGHLGPESAHITEDVDIIGRQEDCHAERDSPIIFKDLVSEVVSGPMVTPISYV